MLDTHLHVGHTATNTPDALPFGANIPAKWRQTINKIVCLFDGGTWGLRKKSPDMHLL